MISAAGAIFYSLNTSRFFFVHRSQGKYKNVWSTVGGKQEKGETAWQTCQREIIEEIGTIDICKIIPLEVSSTCRLEFVYSTFLCITSNEFIPTLNNENDGYAWVKYKKWPAPLHFGLKKTLNKEINLLKLNTLTSILQK
jgi:8-oxo-dGTP pyrophosphatase MutT (NUDIX family)